METEKYWGWVGVTLTEQNFNQIFHSQRFQSIRSVTFSRHDRPTETQLNTFFSGLEDCSLRKLYCNWISISKVDPDILASVIVSMERVLLVVAYLNKDQVNAMFKAISECEDLKLVHLNINANDLSSIPPSILSRAVIRLVEADLFLTKLTDVQVVDLLDSIISAHAAARLKLKRLNIRRGDISKVSPSVAEQVKRILNLFIYL